MTNPPQDYSDNRQHLVASRGRAAHRDDLGPFRPDTKVDAVVGWLNEEPYAQKHNHQHEHDGQTRGESLLRIKGLLNLAEQDRPLVIHGVQHIFHEPRLLQEWPLGDDRHSRLVFITRDLDRSVIEHGAKAFEQAA